MITAHQVLADRRCIEQIIEAFEKGLGPFTVGMSDNSPAVIGHNGKPVMIFEEMREAIFLLDLALCQIEDGLITPEVITFDRIRSLADRRPRQPSQLQFHFQFLIAV
jgi:hypothetical protein